MLKSYERDHKAAEQTAATFLVPDIDRVMQRLLERGVVFKEYETRPQDQRRCL